MHIGIVMKISDEYLNIEISYLIFSLITRNRYQTNYQNHFVFNTLLFHRPLTNQHSTEFQIYHLRYR